MAWARRGLVMDLDGGKAVVLTPKGEFLRLNRVQPGWEVGREIVFEWPEPESRPWWVRPWIGRPAWLAVAVAAVVMLVFMPGLLAQAPAVGPGGPEVTVVEGTIVTYVTVDINPSLELGLDAQDRVVSVTDLNEDAGLLTEGLNLFGQPVDQAVEKLTEAAVEKAFISPGKANGVIISAVPAEPRTAGQIKGAPGSQPPRQDLEAKLESATQKALAKRQVTAPVSVVPLTPEVRDKAKELGVSAGKLMLWARARDQGVKVPIEEFKGRKLAESIRQAGVEPEKIYRQIETPQANQVIKKYEAEIKKEIKARSEASQEEIKLREARDRQRREKERQERLHELKERELEQREEREVKARDAAGREEKLRQLKEKAGKEHEKKEREKKEREKKEREKKEREKKERKKEEHELEERIEEQRESIRETNGMKTSEIPERSAR